MEYQATSKYIRTSTRKMRLIADAIRSLGAEDALTKLAHLSKSAAVPMGEVLASAIANAKGKNADTSALKFKTIEVMGGPVLKRFHAVSKGQAHAFKKRMTHVRIILTEKEPETPAAMPKEVKVKSTEKKSEVKK